MADHRVGTQFRRAAVPRLIGVAVLVVAVAAAVSAGGAPMHIQVASAPTDKPVASASALSGVSAVASSDTTADRERALSRDSQREAIADAAEEDLQEEAEAQAKERNAALAQLAASAEQHAAELAANEWVLPLKPGTYRLSARFGQSSSLWANTHTGLDFAAPAGTPVVSIATGKVTATEYDGSYGNKTVVALENGTEVWYCHLTAFSVNPGDRVDSGQVIGTVGSTGNSTGPHLHLEIRPGAGDAVDPFTALNVHGLNP